MVVVLFAACGGGTGDVTPTSVATAPPTPNRAVATEDPGSLATRVAASTAARLGPTLLSTADYPSDLSVKQQQSKLLVASDVPGLTSDASGYFATLATDTGDEFVNLIVLAAGDETGALGVLDALTPDNYLPGLTVGARDAAATSLDVSAAPIGSKGFGYSGTIPASVPQQTIGHMISGQAIGFVRGSTYVLLVHGLYAASARDIDIAKIAAAIDARLAAGSVN